MKKIINILIFILSIYLLIGCDSLRVSNSSKTNITSNFNTSRSASRISITESYTLPLTTTTTYRNTIISKPITTSTTVTTKATSKITASKSWYSDPTGTNPDQGSKRMPLPLNHNDFINIGSDNASMTTFSFIDSLPEYFRYIYGNNFTNGQYYANGELKFSSSTNAKQGFQTGYINTNKKLEIRINIGQINNSNDGNKIDKDLPVMSIYFFSIDGSLLRTKYIDTITKNNENNYIRVYADGTDVAYIEFRFMQLPYKGSQAYNIGLKGISIIGWPYEYKE